MKRRKKLFYLVALSIFSITIIVLTLIYPKIAIKAASDAISVWLNIILPTLFPFSMVCLILINSGILIQITQKFNNITKKITGFDGCFLFVFICSCLSGYPMGARLIGSLRYNHAIDDTQAGFMLNCASTTGPSFLINSIAIGILKDTTLISALLISHYLSAFIITFYNGRLNKLLNTKDVIKKNEPIQNKSIGSILNDSITSSINGMLSILGFMTLFTVAAKLIQSLSIIKAAVPAYSNEIETIFSGILELTTGCIESCSLDSKASVIFICFFCGFGGASIISQSIALAGINRSFILSKLSQGCLNALIAMLFVGTDVFCAIFMAGTLTICIIVAEISLRKKYHFSLLLLRRLMFSFKSSKLSL